MIELRQNLKRAAASFYRAAIYKRRENSMKQHVTRTLVTFLLAAAMVLSLTITAFAGEASQYAEEVDKSTLPRIIITTDLEVDDMNGILLSLMYSTDYDLAGIVWTAGMFHFNGDGEHTLEEITPNYRCEGGTAGHTVEYIGQVKEFRPVEPEFLERIITDKYARDYVYLSQNNPNYPTPEYLMSIAKEGNVEFEGDYREETEGSQLIYDCIMDDDPRELVIMHWGGINTTVRALYSIYEDYHDTDEWDAVLEKVVNKVRLNGHGEDNCYEDSKIAEMFPGLQDNRRDGYASLGNYFQNVKLGDGPFPFIGTNETLNPYYQAEYLTDAFKFNHGALLGEFHLMGDGQVIYGEPMHYQYGLKTYIDWSEGAELGWGDGAVDFTRMDMDRYDWMCCQFGCNSYVDLGLRQGVSHSEDKYTIALFDDLAARADWAIMAPEECNHAPVITAETLDITAKAGDVVSLSAAAEDPDGNELAASWWIPVGSCTYGVEPPAEGESSGDSSGASNEKAAQISISAADGFETQVTVPEDAQPGDMIVVNLEVHDQNVERPITRYAQFFITVE